MVTNQSGEVIMAKRNGRKTFEVADIRKVANDVLRTSSNGSKDYRYGVLAMIERILMDSGNYHGFMYLSEKDLPEGALPGIRSDVPNIEQFDFTDETRRKYF